MTQKGDWTEQQWREYLWVYYRLTEISDGEAGRVLAALDQAGLAANTVVVFTSDHGEMMGSHRMITKQKLYEESAAVPLIVVPPGGKASVDKQHLVSGLDILPTLLDYAGIAAPSRWKARACARWWREGSAVARFRRIGGNVSVEARMVRTARYKYIVFALGEDREQFFDMENDPGELKNLIADRRLALRGGAASQSLEQWRKDTHDEIGKRSPVKKEMRGKKHSGEDRRNKPGQPMRIRRKIAPPCSRRKTKTTTGS